MGLSSWLCYCSDVLQRRSTKLCTMFGRLLGWYIIYAFSGFLSLNGILPDAKFTFRPSLAFSYWHRYCTALEQWASAKLSGVRQGTELRNFRSSLAAITLGIGPHSSILQLWFLSFFLLFSSPILSGWKLDVCHTSTYDVPIGTDVTVRQSGSGRQPNFVAWYKEWNYGTFAPRHFQERSPPIFRGHHVGHSPTF